MKATAGRFPTDKPNIANLPRANEEMEKRAVVNTVKEKMAHDHAAEKAIKKPAGGQDGSK